MRVEEMASLQFSPPHQPASFLSSPQGGWSRDPKSIQSKNKSSTVVAKGTLERKSFRPEQRARLCNPTSCFELNIKTSLLLLPFCRTVLEDSCI